MCVSEPAVDPGNSIFIFWDLRRPASSKISFTRLLYPCSNISKYFVLAELIIVSKQDNYCENNQAYQGITSENPTLFYLLSNKFFITSLLSFIPLTLQILTECWVHLEEKRETFLMLSHAARYRLLGLNLPKSEWEWHTSGVSNVNE